MNNSNEVPNYKFVHKFIDEKQLISSLITNDRGELNVSLFANLIYDPLDSGVFSTYKGFFVFENVLRKELGFDNEQKPGDFDLLIIPYKDDNVFFDRTCAIEVKVVRSNRLNPRKPPKSYGEEQLNGLIRDGFPLVGLFHVCMTEPLLEEEKVTVTYITGGVGGEDNTPFEDREQIPIKHDFFSSWAAENQMRRLLSKDIPKYVGLTVIGLNVTEDQGLIWSSSLKFNHKYSAGYFNPHKKQTTIDMIHSFFVNNQNQAINLPLKIGRY